MYIPMGQSQKRKVTTRIAVTPETREKMSRIQDGSGMSHDEMINALVTLFRQEGETLEQFGYRVRGLTLMLPPSDQDPK